MEQCQVTANIETVRKDKSVYHAVQVASTNANPNRTTRAMRGHFKKAAVHPKRMVKEFPITEDAHIPIGMSSPITQTRTHNVLGTKLSCVHFVPGQFVDVIAKS